MLICNQQCMTLSYLTEAVQREANENDYLAYYTKQLIIQLYNYVENNSRDLTAALVRGDLIVSQEYVTHIFGSLEHGMQYNQKHSTSGNTN